MDSHSKETAQTYETSPEYQQSVDPRRIRFADSTMTCEHFFRNARVTINKEEMQNLRQHIRKFGLLHTITVRPVKGDPNYDYECVLGSRRLRTVNFFLDQDTDPANPFLVFNKKTGKMERASEVYGPEKFIVNVRDCDDEEAVTLSIGENLERSQLDDIDLMEFCKELSLLKNNDNTPRFSREQIGRMCSRSESWVSLTLKLEELPEYAKELMKSGRLARTAALSLLQTNESKLRDVLDYAKKKVAEEAEVEEEQAEVELQAAMDEMEVAEADAAVASIVSNLTALQQSQRRLGRAKKRVSTASEKRTAAQKKKEQGQITQDHINQANVAIPGAKKGAPKSLPMKTVREKLKEFTEFQSAYQVADNGEMMALKAVQATLEWVLGRRVCPDVISLVKSLNEPEPEILDMPPSNPENVASQDETPDDTPLAA